jgi:hypothetical protein
MVGESGAKCVETAPIPSMQSYLYVITIIIIIIIRVAGESKSYTLQFLYTSSGIIQTAMGTKEKLI